MPAARRPLAIVRARSTSSSTTNTRMCLLLRLLGRQHVTTHGVYTCRRRPHERRVPPGERHLTELIEGVRRARNGRVARISVRPNAAREVVQDLPELIPRILALRCGRRGEGRDHE